MILLRAGHGKARMTKTWRELREQYQVTTAQELVRKIRNKSPAPLPPQDDVPRQ